MRSLSLAIFEAIRALMAPPEKPKKKSGFSLKEPKAGYGKIERKLRED
jgi:hypothetical protein